MRLQVTVLATMALTSMAGTEAAIYELPESTDLVGSVGQVVAAYEDTFVDVGRRNRLGFEELRWANSGVDPWLPGEAAEITLPTAFILPPVPRNGIVVNVAEFRIYYFYSEGGRDYVASFPASVGRMDWDTPLGLTRITAKVERPSWYPPESIRAEHAAEGRSLPRVVPPGPDNPLGNYSLRLSLPSYLIHGTNRPAGVGMRVTHGCIRLFPEDIEWLFPRVSTNTPVRIINQPLKFGWHGDALYLEVHPELEAAYDAGNMTLVTAAYVRATASGEADVDWELVAQVFREKTGIPVRVGSRRAILSQES